MSDCDCDCDCFCICCIPCPPHKKDKCICGNGEVRLNVEEASTVIDLSADRDFHKLPPADEFDTLPIAHQLDFDTGGARARLRWTGDHAAIVVVECDVSVERKQPTIDQHLIMKLNHGAGPGPLTAATLIHDTIQQTNLLSDDQDTMMTISATLKMEPGDLVEVWAAKEGPDSPTDQMNFEIEGFVFRANAIRRA